MASAKRTGDKPEDAIAQAADAVAEVEEKAKEPAPNSSARPNDIPIVPAKVPNSTFAERAKLAGRNKRVAASESK